jgi:hypothetical protein
MQLLNVTTLPIYLPYDKAAVPFGDPFSDLTVTAAAPGVFTAPGYNPTNGDKVIVTFAAGGSLPGGITNTANTGTTFGIPVGFPYTIYYVVGAVASTGAFNLSATLGGSGITTTTTGSLLTLHLFSGQVDGVTLPFKPGNTVLVENNSGGTLVLQGAVDSGALAPGQGYAPPAGPGTWNTIVSLVTGAQALVQLSYDWIRVSTAGTLSLMQN